MSPAIARRLRTLFIDTTLDASTGTWVTPNLEFEIEKAGLEGDEATRIRDIAKSVLDERTGELNWRAVDVRALFKRKETVLTKWEACMKVFADACDKHTDDVAIRSAADIFFRHGTGVCDLDDDDLRPMISVNYDVHGSIVSLRTHSMQSCLLMLLTHIFRGIAGSPRIATAVGQFLGLEASSVPNSPERVAYAILSELLSEIRVSCYRCIICHAN